MAIYSSSRLSLDYRFEKYFNKKFVFNFCQIETIAKDKKLPKQEKINRNVLLASTRKAI